jgi:hypothetical protein
MKSDPKFIMISDVYHEFIFVNNVTVIISLKMVTHT